MGWIKLGWLGYIQHLLHQQQHWRHGLLLRVRLAGLDSGHGTELQWLFNLDLGLFNLDFGRFNLDFGRFNLDFGRFNLDFGRFNVKLGRFNVKLGRFNVKLGWFGS